MVTWSKDGQVNVATSVLFSAVNIDILSGDQCGHVQGGARPPDVCDSRQGRGEPHCLLPGSVWRGEVCVRSQPQTLCPHSGPSAQHWGWVLAGWRHHNHSPDGVLFSSSDHPPGFPGWKRDGDSAERVPCETAVQSLGSAQTKHLLDQTGERLSVSSSYC